MTEDVIGRSEESAHFASVAIGAYMTAKNTDDTDDAIRDLLVDLQHMCKDDGVDFEKLMTVATTNFDEEMDEERAAKLEASPDALKVYRVPVELDYLDTYRATAIVHARDEDEAKRKFLRCEEEGIDLGQEIGTAGIQKRYLADDTIECDGFAPEKADD